jgi:hypothetical protein
MPPLVSTVQSGDVTATVLVGDPSPPMPRPAPPSPAPLITIDVPDSGNPADVALAILYKLKPSVAAEFRSRAATLSEELDELVEFTRLHLDITVSQFCSQATIKLRARAALLARADALEGKPINLPVDVSGAAHTLARSIKRWETGDALRLERARLIRAATAELAEVRAQLRTGLPSSVHGQHGYDRSHANHALGLVDTADNWLVAFESALRRRDQLREQLARLGDDKAGRAKAVTASVATVGREGVIAGLSPKMEALARVRPVRAQMEALDKEIAFIDPATKHHADLSRRRQELLKALEAAGLAEAEERRLRADGVVKAAETGDLDSILALGGLVDRPQLLVADLKQARGNDQQLAATVTELIAEWEAKCQADRDRIAAQQPRRP